MREVLLYSEHEVNNEGQGEKVMHFQLMGLIVPHTQGHSPSHTGT